MSCTYRALPLPLEATPAQIIAVPADQCALEDPDFPFDALSRIAEIESWRKEINRPTYHLHKWWAQRLGSVFRGILLGAVVADPRQVISAFFAPVRFPGIIVFDPFMGSGTTIGEALKLGMRAIGRDINHVAYFAVRNALATHSRANVIATFQSIERDVAEEIKRYYRARLTDGSWADVLYYFWVKVVRCPHCQGSVDLFDSYVFARHAYPKKHPEAQILCPYCGEVNQARYDASEVTCCGCQRHFNPQVGPVNGQRALCPHCKRVFPIVEVVRRQQHPPDHRLYAKLVLLPNGSKIYQRATQEDVALYEAAGRRLAEQPGSFPVVAIQPGHNTNQVLNYSYRYWHEMFNARQLLALSLLADRIRAIEDRDLRYLFTCLFSGTLEFNNMFASYKGEGTGAVRHMFAHHILKPERTPLEANPWGTPKSSGAFSTLFRSRLLRALDYRDHPFEVRPARVNGKVTGRKVYGLSAPLGRTIADTYAAFRECEDAVYLSCGDSASTDLPTGSVDLIITDPPFFDNVHYSELADFFYIWQRYLLRDELGHLPTSTRSDTEVQSRDPAVFAQRLRRVFIECHRVLRPGGLLAFTYHHSRLEGWRAIVASVSGAGFVITAVHPIKSEMSVATPKAQATSPIDLDIIFVCRRKEDQSPMLLRREEAIAAALSMAADQVDRLARQRPLSRNDVKVIVMAQLIKVRSWEIAAGEAKVDDWLDEELAEQTIGQLYCRQASIVNRHDAMGTS
jgi:adenine-specific DNA methylase